MINTNYLTNLRDQLTAHSISKSAIDFLLIVHYMVQILDDVKDGDKVTSKEANNLALYALCELPTNHFYLTHIADLHSVIRNALHKWYAANSLHDQNLRSEVSYVWTNSFFDLVLYVFAIEKGSDWITENGYKIIAMMGESYTQYKESIPCQQ